MLDQQLRLCCQKMISSLAIPRPFDLEAFRRALERERSRPLRFVPTRTDPDCTGLWLAMQDADYIYYERETTTLHQVHIIGHETGHMLLGHQQPPYDDQVIQALFPSLSMDLIRSALHRSAYSCTEEREAETFASLLLERIASELQPATAEEADDELDRVEGAFGRSAAVPAARRRP